MHVEVIVSQTIKSLKTGKWPGNEGVLQAGVQVVKLHLREE